MIQEIKDYAKCMCANKVNLAGAYFLPAGIGLITAAHGITDNESSTNVFALGILFTSIGLSVSSTAAFGYETFNAYKRTKKHIRKFGKIDSRFQYKLSGSYCCAAGFRLAQKESRLEYLLEDKK